MIPRRRAGALAALLLGACSRAPTELPAGDAAIVAAQATSSADVTTAATIPGLDDWGTTADGGPTVFPLGPLPAQAPFEGRLTFQIALTNETEETTEISRYNFTIKGKRARWDLLSKGGKGRPVGYRIYDAAEHKFYTVMRQPEIFVTSEANLTTDAGAGRAWTFTPFALEPKGKVQDYPCDIVDTRDDKYDYHLCLARGLPTVPLHLLGPALELAVPFGAVLEKKALYPLTVLVRPRKGSAVAGPGALVAKLTVVTLERGLVPDNALQLPNFPKTETPRLVAPGLLY